MKNSDIRNIRSAGLRMHRFSLTLALALVACALHFSALAAGSNSNPGALPPSSTPYGRTYSQWAAAWWQWALSIPPEQNPVADTNGQFAAVGQSGPVWFLAGTLGGVAERTVAVPAGKALFFPVLNNLWVTTCVGDPRTIADIRPLIAPFIEVAQGLDVEIDGVSAANLAEYLVESPLFCTSLSLFGVNNATDLAAFCPGGTPDPDCGNLPNPQEHYGTTDGFGTAMTIGYHLMLAPLKAGHHTIHFMATSGDFSVDVTYHLTVK